LSSLCVSLLLSEDAERKCAEEIFYVNSGARVINKIEAFPSALQVMGGKIVGAYSKFNA